MEAGHKETIKILLKITKFCGIGLTDEQSRSCNFYQILTLCVTFSVSVFSVYTNGVIRYTTLTPVHVFIDVLTSTFITIEGTAIQLCGLLFPTTWKKLVHELNLDNTGKHSKTSIYVELFIIHFLFIARFIWNTKVWSTLLGWNAYLPYIFRIFHEYYATISITIMVHVNLLIKNRFRSMNERLLKSPSLFVKKFDPQVQVRQTESTYGKLLHLLDHFNRVFGYQILFIMGNAIVVMLESLRNALKHNEYSNVDEKVLILSWSTLSTVFVLVFYQQFYFCYC